MDKKKLISLCIPVYQNATSLEILYEEIKGHFDNSLKSYDFEICFTNDGSTDGSLEILKSLQKRDSRVRITNFTRNFGQNASTIAAHKLAKGDAIITISADLQDPTDLIPRMIVEWEKGVEFVICFREGRNDSILNKVTSLIYYSMIRFHTSKEIPIGGFDCYLLSKRALDKLNAFSDRGFVRSFHFDLFSLGYKVSKVPYTRLKRVHGKSQIRFFKWFFLFIEALTSTSYIPLRIMPILGVGISTFGFLWAFGIFLQWMRGESPFEGWSAIMVSILIIGGLIILMLGMIGEYIWKIYQETKKRPDYIIDEIIESDEQ